MRSGKQAFTGFVTLLVLTGAYMVYIETIGRLTDFPKVTEQDITPMLDESGEIEADDIAREAHIAAIRAFGHDCVELNADYKWESKPRGAAKGVIGRGVGLYMYIHEYEVLEDPRFVRLTPFSLAYIHPTGDGHADTDAIETVRGDEAIVEFDRPIDIFKFSQPKAVGGWVQGNVELKTNRRTADDADDDVVVFTDKLHYSSDRSLIWADDWIRVFSSDVKVHGVGMELALHPESTAKLSANDDEQSVPSNDSDEEKPSTDFKYIQLMKDVRFDLLVENSDDLFGERDGDAKDEKTSEAEKNSERVPITITSRGAFHFDSETNQATFENAVQMLRRNAPKAPDEQETVDSIDCDHLVLEFSSDEPDKDNKTAGELQSETQRLDLARATATGREVLLFSDSQRLQATGNYLFYDAKARRAILEGEKEMIAFHDNTIIHARSLTIEQGAGKGLQTLVADGPNGWLEMKGKPEGDEEPETELKIRWQGRLQTSPKGDGESQFVEITGNVELEDKDDSALKCDLLKVWLVPVETDEPESVDGKSGSPQRKSRLEPVKLEAHDNVSVDSKELAIVSKTLTMDIIRAEPDMQEAEADEPALEPAAATEGSEKPSDAPQPIVAAPAETPETQEPSQPLAVRADRVAVVVERRGSSSQPVTAWAEGDIVVHQPPKNPDDEALEVRGQTLQFERKPEGEIMQVGGGRRQIAVIKTSEMELAGKEIILNEPQNRVQGVGAGYLIRETKNDITGKPSDTPQMLRIDWSQSMTFDGRLGSFLGDVKAQQGNAEVYCQYMDVAFDRRIIFKDVRDRSPRRDGPQLQIETVDCDQEVVVREIEREGAKVIRVSELTAADLRYDNLYNTVTATGPGRVKSVELAKPKENDKGEPVPPKHPYTLTTVDFQGQMRGNRRNQTAKFFENIHIVHTPAQSPNATVDEQRLPDDGIIIDAVDRAEMREIDLSDGQKSREFQAEGSVRVHARTYWATCDRLTFDQQKDLVVFDSKPGRTAVFYQRERAGQEPVQSRARTFKYRTKTGTLRASNSEGLSELELRSNNK